MPSVENKLTQYKQLLESKKILNERIKEVEESLLKTYNNIPGTYEIGDYWLTIEEKTTRHINVERVEEIVQEDL